LRDRDEGSSYLESLDFNDTKESTPEKAGPARINLLANGNQLKYQKKPYKRQKTQAGAPSVTFNKRV
jgi:hypothetical protein